MLRADGSISFTTELCDLVERFLAEYETRQGPLRAELEEGLVMSYLLGVLRCEVENIWDLLGQAPTFGNLHPRVVFEDCLGRSTAAGAAHRAEIEAELRRRGWLPDKE